MTNKKSTKRALLLSLLSMLLCITMLVGTTFAWFTDSVTSSGNIIKSGTLEIEMYWAEGTEDPSTATWTDASTSAIFNYDNWEPGYVDVKHVKISNVGSLAFKYVVNIKANGAVSELAEVIDVYFVDPAAQVSGRSALVDSYKVGTLAEILRGEVSPARGDLAKDESDTVTIALKMQESAGNEYQDLSIGSDFSVQVLATQLTYEDDSFGNDYDEGAVTHVVYDSTKTVAENAAALQAALDAAKEGDIILLGAGNWYATQYKQFKINTDGITLLGENGAVLGFKAENRNSILDVHGDNVTIRNVEFNKNKQEFNQCILAIGAENLTVDSCTFYGENYKGGNTPTMGIYIFENLDMASDEANDEVTKYTIINNNFLGAAVGTYKGGAETVPNDPGAATAQVSEDMIIENNTFIGANVLIENWRSWSKECTRDHEFVPTIKNNIFESPNLCFANTPHSIYLRCYRQGDPDKILPADYMDNFVANNTVATPSNDTVVTYNGTDYVLNSNYGTFYRDNATYGTIAYCYGQSYATYVSDSAELQAAINSGVSDIALGKGEFTADLYVVPASRNLTITGQGADTKLNFKKGQVRLELFDTLTISNCTIGRMVDKTWGQLVFASSTTDGGVYTLSNCIFNGESTQGIYINQSKKATFNIDNCTFNGDFGSEGAITIQNNDGCDITVNVTDCEFNNIPATSHEIYILYAYNGWTLNADGVNAFWKANP